MNKFVRVDNVIVDLSKVLAIFIAPHQDEPPGFCMVALLEGKEQGFPLAKWTTKEKTIQGVIDFSKVIEKIENGGCA